MMEMQTMDKYFIPSAIAFCLLLWGGTIAAAQGYIVIAVLTHAVLVVMYGVRWSFISKRIWQ